MPIAMEHPPKELSAQEARSAALGYVTDAFAEAALCTAMCELVAAHGEDGAAEVAARLADRAAAGEFSVARRQ